MIDRELNQHIKNLISRQAEAAGKTLTRNERRAKLREYRKAVKHIKKRDKGN